MLDNIYDELEALENRLNALERESADIKSRIDVVKQELFEARGGRDTINIQQPVEYYEEPVSIPVENVSEPFVQSAIQGEKTHKKKDMETVIGKNFMGVMASVLIFIGIILVAMVVLPLFDDVLKQVAIYTISAAFTGAGLWKMSKNRENVFLHAVAACGLGGLYISLLLSNMYFKSINDIVLFVCIFIWAMFICFLGRMHSTTFEVIGWLGICISIILGGILCVETGDDGRLLFLSIFFAISSAVFLVSHWRAEVSKNLAGYCIILYNIVFLTSICIALNGSFMYATLGLIMCYGVLVYASLYIKKLSSNRNVGFIIATTLYGLYFAIYINGFWGRYNAILTLSIFIIWWILEEYKMWKTSDASRYILHGVYLFSIFVVTGGVSFLSANIYVSAFAAILLVIAFLTERREYLLYSFIYIGIYSFFEAENPIIQLVIFMALLAGAFAYIHIKNTHKAFKICWYIITMFVLYRMPFSIVDKLDANEDIIILGFFIACIANAVMIFTKFVKEPKALGIFARIDNGINMFIILLIIASSEGYLHILAILVALAIYMLYSKQVLDTIEAVIGGVIVGGKFTVLAIVILASFEAAAPVISIACLLLAIGCIILGFVFKYKSIRIYGLILTMLSVVKLVMFDIAYDNSIGHALSFLAAGVLVFVVNLIYNIIDKNIKKRDELGEV